MTLNSLTFESLIPDLAQIIGGTKGWDSIMHTFIEDQRGRAGFGLLSKCIGLQPATSVLGGQGTVIFRWAPGWYAIPMFVLVRTNTASLEPPPTSETNSRYHFVTGQATSGSPGYVVNPPQFGAQLYRPWATGVPLDRLAWDEYNRGVIVFPGPQQFSGDTPSLYGEYV